ncbi:MaoC family dehydratase [Granulosicoccus antarcticus]|uniref:Bifunctional protein PaaZ n=1 Tax=Granulosicoccus antarcticus IMCC3135 TaxID=1192854 RepID=A0A2Z2NVK0_9GAMM|nr:MaoC/PaaZ C-terminal domain-containing protein [Granulosicoccus antarcticus]ASJ74061.1 Bifunctional protein PaaZ [Granulosicoccus antarcticus IMCC3135]
MIVQQFFEDHEIGAGRQTFGRTITETDFVVHAGHSGDYFPHHMDAEWCATQEFGQRIAHGTMIFTIGIGLSASVINPVAFSLGYDRLRFLKPVHIGDTIHTVLAIKDKYPDKKHADHGRVIESVNVINQEGVCVLYCEHIYLVQRRPSVDSD